jgi:Putative MetA-pathway of phenol degradation
VRDFISTVNSVDLRVHQYTVYLTLGITSRFDVSVAIPFLHIQENVNTSATIVSNSVAPTLPGNPFPGNVFHQFNPPVVTSCGSTVPCLQAPFRNSGNANGIGDVVFRGKYEVYKGERVGFALGTDVRINSGDAENFLGSGSVGVRPFGVISYSARISPHADIGYEINGDSILAGNIVGPTATNAKGSLPNRFTYIVGVDVAVVKRLTVAFDFYGQRQFSVPQLVSSPFTDFGKCGDLACSTLTAGTAHPDVAVRSNVDYNILNAAVGLKYRVYKNLVLSGNVLFKLNDSGLRAKVVPLAGISYSF